MARIVTYEPFPMTGEILGCIISIVLGVSGGLKTYGVYSWLRSSRDRRVCEDSGRII